MPVEIGLGCITLHHDDVIMLCVSFTTSYLAWLKNECSAKAVGKRGVLRALPSERLQDKRGRLLIALARSEIGVKL